MPNDQDSLLQLARRALACLRRDRNVPKALCAYFTQSITVATEGDNSAEAEAPSGLTVEEAWANVVDLAGRTAWRLPLGAEREAAVALVSAATGPAQKSAKAA